MIANFFITLYSLAVTTYSVAPNLRLPQSWMDVISEIIGFMNAFNGLFPIRLLFEVVAFLLFIKMMIWFLKIVLSGINFIRGVGRLEI